MVDLLISIDCDCDNGGRWVGMDIQKFDKVEVIDKDSEYHYWIGVVTEIDSNKRAYTVCFPNERCFQFDENSIRIMARTWRED